MLDEPVQSRRGNSRPKSDLDSNVERSLPHTIRHFPVEDIRSVKFDDDLGVDVKVLDSQDRETSLLITFCRGDVQFARQNAETKRGKYNRRATRRCGRSHAEDKTAPQAGAGDCMFRCPHFTQTSSRHPAVKNETPTPTTQCS